MRISEFQATNQQKSNYCYTLPEACGDDYYVNFSLRVAWEVSHNPTMMEGERDMCLFNVISQRPRIDIFVL